MRTSFNQPSRSIRPHPCSGPAPEHKTGEQGGVPIPHRTTLFGGLTPSTSSTSTVSGGAWGSGMGGGIMPFCDDVAPHHRLCEEEGPGIGPPYPRAPAAEKAVVQRIGWALGSSGQKPGLTLEV